MAYIYNTDIGIAVFGYNRPRELEKTLSKLSIFVNSSIFNIKVIVFIDGPKNKKDIKSTGMISLFTQKFSNFEFRISKTNKGLKNSIYNGLDEISDNFEYFFVFEDDIILLSNLDNVICNVLQKSLLDAYSSVCLYCPLGINLRNFFSKIKLIETYRMQCWGWFTSSKNWKYFRRECSDDLLHSIDKDDYIFQIGEDSYNRLQETIFQKRPLWANQWIAFNKVVTKPSLVLSCSFATNIGIGTGANKFSNFSKIKEIFNFFVSKIKLFFAKTDDVKIKKISKSELEIITNRQIF